LHFSGSELKGFIARAKTPDLYTFFYAKENMKKNIINIPESVPECCSAALTNPSTLETFQW